MTIVLPFCAKEPGNHQNNFRLFSKAIVLPFCAKEPGNHQNNFWLFSTAIILPDCPQESGNHQNSFSLLSKTSNLFGEKNLEIIKVFSHFCPRL